MSDSNEVIGRAAIVLAAEGEQFDADMGRYGRTMQKFGEDAKQSSDKSVTALNTIGTAAGQTADKMSASQTRFLQSLQRQVVAVEGGKIAAIELKAAQLGLADAAAPLINNWRQLEAAQRSAAASSDAAAASTDHLAESEGAAASRIQAMVAASLEHTAALNKEIDASLRAATAARELGDSGKGSGSAVNFAAQNRSLQETANQVNEVNQALASIGRGASSTKDLQSQTDKLVTLWATGRISADQYAAALKQLDASEVGLAKSSQQASAKADEFIAKLKDQAATAGLTSKQLLEYRANQLGVTNEASPFIDKIAASEKAVHSFSLETGGARRELGVLAREIGRGDFGAASRSFSIFAERSGLMATLLSPAAVAVGLLAAGVAALGLAYYQGHSEQTKFTDALILTNDAAGETAEGLHMLALNAAASGGSLSVAKEAVLQLATSGKFTSEQIALISTTATEMEQATGQAVKETVKQFEELAKSPAEASAKLNEQYHYLTQSVYDQIAALERQGDAQGAADLAEKTYANAMRERTAEITGNIGSIERAWMSAKNAARGFWDEVMNIGRTDQYDHDIAEYKKRLSIGVWSPEDRAGIEQRIAGLQKLSDAARAAATQKADDAKTASASIESARAIDQQSESIDKNIRKRNDLLKLTERFTAMQAEAQRTGQRNERLDNVDFTEDGKPTGGGLFDQLRKDIEERNKPKAAPKGNDNAANAQLKALQGQLQDQERAVKLSLQNLKTQYDIGVLDTQEYLTAEYEVRKSALAKELDIAQQQEAIAARKKNPVALEEAKNQEKKIRDEQIANEQKYTDDTQALMAKNQRDVQAYVDSLSASYKTRQQAIANLVSGAGLGDADRDELNRMNQVQQEYDKAAESLRKSLEKGSAHGGINQGQYDQELAALQVNLQQRLDLEKGYSESLKQTQADGWNGASRFMANYQRNAQNVAAQVEGVFGTASKGMEDAFSTFVTTGKLSFSSLATSVIADIARMQARAAISGLFNFAISAVSSYFGGGTSAGMESSSASTASAWSSSTGGGLGFKANALGGVYHSPDLSSYSNTIVSKPTLFAFAKGAGLMGEAGDEAIMPLTRAADGSLGVRSVGTGAAPNIQIINQIDISSTGAQTTTSTDSQNQAAKELSDMVSSAATQAVNRACSQGGRVWNLLNGRG